MSGAIVNLGELSKPATVLIEKISEAVGGVFKPYQVVRVAKAEAEADKIRAAAAIEVEDLHRRALHRFLLEEGSKQENMEAITSKALPMLSDGAKPEELEKDWITNFFDKCRLISDQEMQTLWSRVLAGEAGSPGTFSKRTINFLGSLDKADAATFTSLCSFCWMVGGLTALVFKIDDAIYKDKGINFGSLTQLDAIGLVRFDNLAGFRRIGLPKKFPAFYYGRPLELEFPSETNNEIETGHVLLTKLGTELATICGSSANPDFFEYVTRKWTPFIAKPSESTTSGAAAGGSASQTYHLKCRALMGAGQQTVEADGRT
jgi:hypothetical protein